MMSTTSIFLFGSMPSNSILPLRRKPRSKVGFPSKSSNRIWVSSSSWLYNPVGWLDGLLPQGRGGVAGQPPYNYECSLPRPKPGGSQTNTTNT